MALLLLRDLREHPSSHGRSAVPVAELVRAELVATVVGVAVTPGQVVSAGQELVLLETMKMEVPVVPEGAGTVARVAVGPGDVVQAGDLLVELT